MRALAYQRADAVLFRRLDAIERARSNLWGAAYWAARAVARGYVDCSECDKVHAKAKRIEASAMNLAQRHYDSIVSKGL